MKFAKRPEVVIIDIPGELQTLFNRFVSFVVKLQKRVPIVDTGAGRRFAADV